MPDLIRCQECGGMIEFDSPMDGGEGHCVECAEVWCPQKAARTRARKRFELVVAMVTGETTTGDDVTEPQKWSRFYTGLADAILTELYGEVENDLS